ncbi:MAG TPA: glycosyltransferase [Rhizomicrobium sp.]|nr:glycosyltransferase [Rhizomicrobium sp.]
MSAITEWTRQQIAAGHRVSLIFSPLRDPPENFRNDLDQRIALVPLEVQRDIDLVSDYRACRRLATILREIRPDVLHLHSSKAGAIGRIAARLVGVPAIYSTHGMSYLRTDVGPATRALFYGLEWLLGLTGATTVACSASELRSMRFIPGTKMDIPNGIDLSILPSPIPAPPHEGLDVLLCGRITAQKNPALACRIAALSPPSWRWTWLGGGELEDVVRESRRIAVTGWITRTQALARLQTGDVMVHTSSWEGMPIAILEAMAAGLPVVATDVVGNRDLIVTGETGFTAGDETGFLHELSKLAAAPELRAKMGIAARQRVAEKFNHATLGRRWMTLYEQTVGIHKK